MPSRKEKTDILVFAAHPDDAELCCGGTILKHIRLGKKVAIVDLTEGELGTRGTKEIRSKEAEKATKMMGIFYRHNLKMPDGDIQYHDQNKRKIIEQIRLLKPETVICNVPFDRHPDHHNASKLERDSCFFSGLKKIETQYNGKTQEAWRPKNVLFYIQDYYHKPDLVVDISEVVDEKYEIIKCFASQFRSPHSNEPETPLSTKTFFEVRRGRDADLGRSIGVSYGEGFLSEKPIGINAFDTLISVKF